MTAHDTRGNVHGSRVSSFLYQAVTWSLSSPFYNDTLHLTGVHISPNEGNLEKKIDTLTVHSNHPSYEPHIYAGDFNAYTAEEIENYTTPLDSHTLFRRTGGTNPAHSPPSPLSMATAPAANYRGRLLLKLLNSIDFIITNGRFPLLSPNHRLYTFFQKPNYSLLSDSRLTKPPVLLFTSLPATISFSPPPDDIHCPSHVRVHLTNIKCSSVTYVTQDGIWTVFSHPSLPSHMEPGNAPYVPHLLVLYDDCLVTQHP